MPKNLTAESYSLLLQTFSSDEKAAAIDFTKLRDSLVRFFQIKGDSAPEESADETLDRVAAKLGEAVRIENTTNYSFGVARLVFLENLRKTQKAKTLLENYQPATEWREADEATDDFAALRECFAELTGNEKKILQSYFADLPPARLDEKRRELSASLDISLNNLRLKVFRLRRRLEECVRGRKNNSG